ncbi:MAG TPA: hypothetical protein VFW80_10315 [Gaiellaceae bacterium]|nr:hypothetical protein [Gaiellaceae bacterium]
MIRKDSYRPIPLALTALVAILSAAVALAVSGGHDAAAHGNAHHATAAVVNQKQLEFRNDMRKLWEDHVTWTRLAIISLTTESPDTDATVGRLLQNQVDIGDAIKPFYGAAAGDELTRLLRDHILIAADLVAAAKKGDSDAVADAQTRWTANADEIAGFLASANPRFWPLDEMKPMLHRHLALTTDEALARLNADWDADVAAYDRIHVQALGMADMLSTGIIGQFPKRFH